MDNCIGHPDKISKVEWFAAALIDLIPLSIFINIFPIFSDFKFGFDTNIVFSVISFAYLLLKDCWGASLGKRIMGITVKKNGSSANGFILSLRNLL